MGMDEGRESDSEVAVIDMINKCWISRVITSLVCRLRALNL